MEEDGHSLLFILIALKVVSFEAITKPKCSNNMHFNNIYSPILYSSARILFKICCTVKKCQKT